MNVPHCRYLHSQSFNSKFIEFVWHFPTDTGRNQIIFKSYSDGSTYLEEGLIGNDGEYNDKSYATSGIISTKNITSEELQNLKKEVIKYLNE